MELRVYWRSRPQYREYEIHRNGCSCAPSGYNFNPPQNNATEALLRSQIKEQDNTAHVILGPCCRIVRDDAWYRRGGEEDSWGQC